MTVGPTRIVIAGGGLVGLTVAQRLERHFARGDQLRVHATLVSPENAMTYQSLLPEVASGMLEPRHVVVPLREALPRTEVVTGWLTDVDADGKVATVQPHEGPDRELRYDHLVLALGSSTKVLPVPGLEEKAIGFQSVAEALYLRNHVLERMETAQSTPDRDVRRRALTFVFVGGGYSGVEAIGELQDMAIDACRFFPNLEPKDLRWLLVEATGRILPMVDESLARYAEEALRSRGVDVRLETVLESAEDGLTLSDGTTVEADTLVWAAGVQPSTLPAQLGLPVSASGAVQVDATLQVSGGQGVVEGLWAAGDGAAVPDLEGGGVCPPSAQYALRQARQLADSLAAVVRGQQPGEFRFRQLGEMITIGRHDGVAQLLGYDLRGFLPWWIRRLYHVGRIPRWERKLRVWIDWTVSLAFPRDVVSLGSLEHPEAPFRTAAERQRDAA